MNDLLEVAKAVIDVYDNSSYSIALHESLTALRAAVERAENTPTDFDEWWLRNDFAYIEVPGEIAREIWIAAQQAERERCREIVITMGGPDVPELLRQIDSGEE